MNIVNKDITGRTLHTTSLLHATPEAVWAAWTRPEQLEQWWGPERFTCAVHSLELATGGEWLLTLYGPDGKRYPNKSIFREIDPLRKITFRHYNPAYFATVLFQPEAGGTRIDWTVAFESTEVFYAVVKVFKADEGLAQNIYKLERYLAGGHQS